MLDNKIRHIIVPLEKLQNIEIKKGLAHGTFLINNEELGDLVIDEGISFVRKACDHFCARAVEFCQSSQQSNNTEDSGLDKIKKLKELLDVGALTEEEFENKKQEILKNI